MKLIIITICCMFSITANCQPIYLNTATSLINRINNNASIKVVTDFIIGYQATCPIMAYFKDELRNDTLYVNCFYDISGAWPLVGCNRKDTINVSTLTSQINYLNVNVNSINENDTDLYLDDTTFILTATGIESNNSIYFSLFPNPVNNEMTIEGAKEGSKITVYSLFGQSLLQHTLHGNKDVISMVHFAKGIYLLVFKTNDGKMNKLLKIYKE